MKLVFPSLFYKEKAEQFVDEFYSEIFKEDIQKYIIKR